MVEATKVSEDSNQSNKSLWGYVKFFRYYIWSSIAVVFTVFFWAQDDVFKSDAERVIVTLCPRLLYGKE